MVYNYNYLIETKQLTKLNPRDYKMFEVNENNIAAEKFKAFGASFEVRGTVSNTYGQLSNKCSFWCNGEWVGSYENGFNNGVNYLKEYGYKFAV